MSYFYVQACSNGHYNITNKKLKEGAVCDDCHMPIIDKCPHCGEYIRKWTLYGATPILPGKEDYTLPSICAKCGRPFPWAMEDATLIRKAYDEENWKEFDRCSFAFFPGCKLCAFEPEIVVKAYDAIRFQHPDTGLFLHCCDYDVERIRQGWIDMGRPTMIVCCINCLARFREFLPEINTISIYEFIRNNEISGGCNTVEFVAAKSLNGDDSETIQLAINLAEDMGATLKNADDTKQLDEIDLPYLTLSIAERNSLIKSGKDAAHILELIFGFGAVNEWLEHEHHHEGEVLDGADVEAEATAESQLDQCSGLCSSCTSCNSSCDQNKASHSQVQALPSPEEEWENRLQLKKLMLEFFWNEID